MAAGHRVVHGGTRYAAPVRVDAAVLLIPYLLSAIRIYENGLASRGDIDTAMKLGCGYPLGPFQLLDYIDLDTTLHAAEAIYHDYPDPANAPPPLLRHMVAAGRLGTKVGTGFYEYAQSR